jgi:hypothetical protein
MSDDLKTAKTALAKLHQDMEAINKLAKPSYLGVIEQMERTLKPIRRHQLEISRSLEMSGSMARIQEIASANQHWQELIMQATATSRIAESLAESLREISDITRLPVFVLPGATREIYTTSFAIETLRPWDERDDDEAETEIQLVAEAELETSGCIALLQQVDPGLARPHIGARNALCGCMGPLRRCG